MNSPYKKYHYTNHSTVRFEKNDSVSKNNHDCEEKMEQYWVQCQYHTINPKFCAFWRNPKTKHKKKSTTKIKSHRYSINTQQGQ